MIFTNYFEVTYLQYYNIYMKELVELDDMGFRFNFDDEFWLFAGFDLVKVKFGA